MPNLWILLDQWCGRLGKFVSTMAKVSLLGLFAGNAVWIQWGLWNMTRQMNCHEAFRSRTFVKVCIDKKGNWVYKENAWEENDQTVMISSIKWQQYMRSFHWKSSSQSESVWQRETNPLQSRSSTASVAVTSQQYQWCGYDILLVFEITATVAYIACCYRWLVNEW